MPRKPDPRRRLQLLEAAVDYAIEHGLADLTLRPLADALGVTPNTLEHHFDSKEELLSAILNGVRDRLRAMRTQTDVESSPNDLAAARAVWEWTSSPAHLPFFRSFFEAYGLALHQPERFRPFLERVVADWIGAEQLERDTLGLAVVRGLLLDLLTTGERERVDAAFERYLAQTAAMGIAPV